VLLSCHYLASGRTLLALVPVLSATLSYWILGGRNRAVVSLTAGLLLLWYLYRQKKHWPKITLTNRYIFIAAFGIGSVIWVSYLGALYRGELGVRAFAEALSFQGLREYLAASIFTDLGQLHSLAGAIAVGPGVLGGQTFLGALTWPLNKLIYIPGRSAGVFIVETLVGFTTEEGKWAVNASLIGDAYLNFGLWGVPIVMALYGAVAKVLYVKFRQGRVQAAVYVLALICGLQMSWASIEVWPQTLTLLVFTRGLIFAGETVFQVRRRRI
jgi:oligosaccharide repeat unit polymerase